MSAVPHALGVLRRRPVVGLLASLALALALVLGALALWARGEAARVAAGFDDVLVVTATLDPALDQTATQALLDKIAAVPDVKTVRYVTPTEERARLAERVGANLLQGLDDDALPAPPTLDITLDRGALSDAGRAALDLWRGGGGGGAGLGGRGGGGRDGDRRAASREHLRPVPGPAW